MTKYRELMEQALKNNAERIDELKKNERIIFQADRFVKKWSELGGRGSLECNCLNIYGSNAEASQTTMKAFKILMDEYFFSNPDFEIDSKSQSSWIFITVRDKVNGGYYSIDLGMAAMKGCVKQVRQVPVTDRFCEEISYKCEEDPNEPT